MSSLRYIEEVVTLSLDLEKCVGCGMCLQVCPHAVFLRNDKKVKLNDKGACIECGACAKNCPVEAIFVRTGTGCAAYVINKLTGGTGDCCGCAMAGEGDDSDSCC